MSIALLPFVLAVAPLGAAGSPPGSAPEAWARLGSCRAALSSPEEAVDWDDALACQSAARDVLRLGNEGDRDRLWDLWEQSDPAMRSLILDSFVDSYVREELRGLGDARPAPPFVPATEDLELPEGLANASVELRRAVLLYQDLWRRTWREAAPPDGEAIAFASAEGRPQFERVVSDFLRERSGSAETHAALGRFEYGGGCGNGAREFSGTLAAVRLIASLREGHVDPEAAATYVMTLRTPGDQSGLDKEMLTAAGLDWEALFVGELASRQGIHVEPLVRAGSDRAARLLLEVADLASATPSHVADVRRLLLVPMAAFVAREGYCEGYGASSSSDYERAEDAPSIDPALQDAILERLEQAVQPGAGLDEADAASHALLRLCRPDSAAAFSAMLRSPYSEVRRRGALALRALGESIPDPGPSAPVTFRLLVDGRPWTSTVQWVLAGEGVQMSSTPTDREGILRLDRDPFLDPTAPIEAVRLGSDELASPGGTWFSRRVVPPADLDVRTLVAVETGSLTVVVPPSVAPPAPGRRGASLSLFFETDDGQESVISDLPVRAGRTVFPHLQHGRYTAMVFVPGAAVLGSAEVEVGARPATVAVAPVVPHELEPMVDAEDPQTEP